MDMKARLPTLNYTSPTTTRRDVERLRGTVLLLLGYLPAALLFAFMLFCFAALFGVGIWLR